MEDTFNSLDAQSERAKKKVDRSAAYPARSIEDSLRLVGEIYKNFRNAFARRNDIVDLIENTHPRHIAAATHYGLLNREKDSYQVTELYKTIAINGLDEREIKLSLLKAFGAPTLNQELIEKFDGDSIPNALVAHLSRFHRITEDAAPLAAEVFLKNAKYCGILDDNNVLNYKRNLLRLENPAAVSSEQPLVNDKVNSATDTILDAIFKEDLVAQAKASETPTALLPEMINEERVKVRLTGKKFAYLIFPLDITKTDIQILKKEIEQLELTIE
ncbi:MAG: hypothetical protein EOO43_24795 [Flavobacterium sp.]|nr:MAG: hypothetical protein EOO43_24795 [Flavobacterium sp.]